MFNLNEASTSEIPFEVKVGSEIFYQYFPGVHSADANELIADLRKYNPDETGQQLAAALRFAAGELRSELRGGLIDIRLKLRGLISDVEEAAEQLEAQD